MKADVCDTCGLLKSGHTQESRRRSREQGLPEPCGDYHHDNPPSPYVDQLDVLNIMLNNRKSEQSQPDYRPVETIENATQEYWAATRSTYVSDLGAHNIEQCCPSGHDSEEEARACEKGATMPTISRFVTSNGLDEPGTAV